MSAPVDVLAVMEAAAVALNYPIGMRSSELVDRRDALRSARAAVAELVAKADAVAGTLEMPALVKQSTKNANAGFIDWRDWCALKGEVAALRAALARVGGAK